MGVPVCACLRRNMRVSVGGVAVDSGDVVNVAATPTTESAASVTGVAGRVVSTHLPRDTRMERKLRWN